MRVSHKQIVTRRGTEAAVLVPVEVWRRLQAAAKPSLKHKKSDTLYEDAMIAAIAKVNKLIVVTRNVTDFESFDVKLLNPFDHSENG
jgi:predicted nucleic acid-binding protein